MVRLARFEFGNDDEGAVVVDVDVVVEIVTGIGNLGVVVVDVFTFVLLLLLLFSGSTYSSIKVVGFLPDDDDVDEVEGFEATIVVLFLLLF